MMGRFSMVQGFLLPNQLGRCVLQQIDLLGAGWNISSSCRDSGCGDKAARGTRSMFQLQWNIKKMRANNGFQAFFGIG